MKRAAFTFTLLCLAGCDGGIDWSRHLSLRAYGRGLVLSEIDPDEQTKAVVRPQLDYVSISVERVFFRNVPAALTGAVAVGLEITGLAAGDQTVKTVIGVKDIGPSRELRFDEAIAISPTLYTGREVSVKLHFRRMPGAHKQDALGRIQGTADLLSKLDPAIPKSLTQPLRIFQQVIDGPAAANNPLWSYSTAFLPPSAIRDKPDRIFTAARHILILLPPKGTPGAWGKLNAATLPKYLRVEGGRLVWRHSGQEYDATPHVIINVRRYRRYPKETDVEKFMRRADVLYEQGTRGGFFLLGRIALMSAAEALVNDQVLTGPEKNLTREWIEFRRRRYDADEAKFKGDKKTQLEHMYGEIRALGVIRQEFEKILYPFEVKDIEYKVASLANQTKELAAELNEPEKRLADLLSVYKLTERVIELTKTKIVDRVIRVSTPSAEQFGSAPDDPAVKSAGEPDPKLVDIAAAALATPPDQKELEGGVSSQPFYKKWWFWTVVGAVAIGGAAAYGIQALSTSYRGGTPISGGGLVPFGRP